MSSNYIGEIFPCQVQNILHKTVFYKHILTYLTFLFLIVLTQYNLEDIEYNKVYSLLLKSVLLYIVFIIFVKTNKTTFLISLIILLILYLFHIFKLSNIKKKKEDQNIKNKILLNKILKILHITFFINIIVGFLLYMKDKKIEYKDTFNYITFIFGKPICEKNSIY